MNRADALLADYAKAKHASRPYSELRLAAGAAHDSWRFTPFPVVFERGEGAYKWDVGGHRYVDLWMGHGSLMLGNAHPPVVEAVSRQMALGQHLGGVHQLQHKWAELIAQAVPSCELIRFTASGTEATLLAMRVARAYTRRGRILRVDGHFHGWHDDALAHSVPGQGSGMNPGAAENVSIVPALDIGSVETELEEGDVAAVVLEPGGGSAGCLPWTIPYLKALRELTLAYGTLLIFDEVISGFRYALSGVQGLAGVTPDLTVLAKIAAGGMPGGIVGGRAAVMGVIGGGQASDGSAAHVPHSGTFNGFALSAAAACTTLELLGDGSALLRAETGAARITVGINQAAYRLGIDVRAFHQSSIFHLMIGSVAEGVAAEPGPAAFVLARRNAELHRLLRAALLLENIDCHASHGWVSAAHDDGVIDEALNNFSNALLRLGEIPEFAAPPARAASHSPASCEGSCHQHDCAARLRRVAGCSLPLASVPIERKT